MPEEEGSEEQLSVLAELQEPAAVLPAKAAMSGVPGGCMGQRAIG